MNKKALTISVVMFVALLVLVIFFGRVTISTNTENAQLTINNQTKNLPYVGYLLIGTYSLEIKENNHVTIKDNLKIKPGENKFFYSLKTKEQWFVDQLPISNDYFDIDYNQKDNFFFVLNKKEDKGKSKEELSSLFNQSGLDINNYSIVISDVAGIGESTGP